MPNTDTNNQNTVDSLLTDTSVKRTPRVGPCLSLLLERVDCIPTVCFSQTTTSHPRRPRGSQSGRKKRRDESLQARATVQGMLAPERAEKMLYIIVPNRPEFVS